MESRNPPPEGERAHGIRWRTEREMLAARVEELERERDSLNERCRQREVELDAIHHSRMWRSWMGYHAFRSKIRAILSPVLAPGATLRSVAARIAGAGGSEEPAVSEQGLGQSPPAPSPAQGAEDSHHVSETHSEEPQECPPEAEPFDPEGLRPKITWPTNLVASDAYPQRSVLVLGIYLANRQNNVIDIVETIVGSASFRVEQRWIALGGDPPSKSVADVTVERVTEITPKGELINRQIDAVDLQPFDYVVLCDDDVVLPIGFLDGFLGLQERLEYRIAQPARTLNSFIDLPIVEQHPGLLARQTLFVEQGPVVSFHRSAFDLVFPFDLTSPMGWGLENVWSLRASERGLKMGIIDNVPVDHSMRKPVANYAWDEADKGRSALFASTAHRPNEECFKVIDIVRPGDLG